MKPQRRTYDGYLSSPEKETIGRVYFLGRVRVVIKREFSRAEWDADRKLPPKFEGAENSRGGVIPGTSGPVEDPEFDNSQEPPPDHAFFYGIDYV